MENKYMLIEIKECQKLKEIAGAAKESWDKGWLSREAVHLKNLLTDKINMDDRVNKEK